MVKKLIIAILAATMFVGYGAFAPRPAQADTNSTIAIAAAAIVGLLTFDEFNRPYYVQDGYRCYVPDDVADYYFQMNFGDWYGPYRDDWFNNRRAFVSEWQHRDYAYGGGYGRDYSRANDTYDSGRDYSRANDTYNSGRDYSRGNDTYNSGRDYSRANDTYNSGRDYSRGNDTYNSGRDYSRGNDASRDYRYTQSRGSQQPANNHQDRGDHRDRGNGSGNDRGH